MTISEQRVRGAFKAAFIGTLIVSVAVAVLGSIVGYLTAGSAGVWGALVGAAIGVFFCATTAVAMFASARMPLSRGSLILVLTWLAKVIVVVIVLIILRSMSFYSPGVLFGCVVAIVLGALVVDAVCAQRARIPYYDDSTPPPSM